MQSQLNYTRTRLLRRAAFDGVQTAGRSSFSSLLQKAQYQTRAYCKRRRGSLQVRTEKGSQME